LDNVPEDAEALRAAFLAMRSEAAALKIENARLAAENTYLDTLNQKLAHYVAKLKRLSFGPSSERLDPDQLQLALEDIEQKIAEVQAEHERAIPAEKAKRTRERRDARPSLPVHLPEVYVTIEPASLACPCCQGALHRIGEDAARRLDVIPVQYRILVTHRPKYACRACEGTIVQAPAPERLISGGLPTEAMVASVLVNKYADHQPLYRQSQALARQGIRIDRSTLAFWVGYAAAELKPLWGRMREELLTSSQLFVDETTAPVLDPGRGSTKTGYMWAIAQDQRRWGGSDPTAVVFTYAPGRGHDHAIDLLKDFKGVVQCDGYGAYKTLAKRRPNEVALSHCWSHVRRDFIDLSKEGLTPIATEALRRIAEFYAVEAEIRGRPPQERRSVRQAKTKPLIQDMNVWLNERLSEVPGRLPTAGVIRYVLNHWDGLTRFLDDGHLELDTNSVERAIRPIATTESLCTPSSSVCKHWNLVLRFQVTRATFTPHRLSDTLALKIAGPNLIGRARDNLLCREDASLDQLADAVAGDPALLRSISQSKPSSILLGREIGVDTSDPADRPDAVRRPGLALARRQSHAVQSGGDVLIGPASGHGADHSQGVVRGVAVVTAGRRLAEPELGMLPALPVDEKDDLARLFVDIGGDLVHQRSQQLLAGPHRHIGRRQSCPKIIGQAREIRSWRRGDSIGRGRQSGLAVLNAA